MQDQQSNTVERKSLDSAGSGDSNEVEIKLPAHETSAKKIEANRQNSRKSTGPKTAEGKSKSSKNAWTHGFTSREALILTDDQEEYEKNRNEYRRSLDPIGVHEEMLSDAIFASWWRFRRTFTIDSGIFNNLCADGWNLGKAFTMFSDKDFFGKLTRYQVAIERTLYRLLHELQRAQAARKGREVALPVVIDVSVLDQNRD